MVHMYILSIFCVTGEMMTSVNCKNAIFDHPITRVFCKAFCKLSICIFAFCKLPIPMS